VEETVAEVYKDFEVAALVDPERMKRRSYGTSSDTPPLQAEIQNKHTGVFVTVLFGSVKCY